MDSKTKTTARFTSSPPYSVNFPRLFVAMQILCKVTLEVAAAICTFSRLCYPDMTLLMPPITSSSFSLLCCKTAGFVEIIGLCLNPMQLFPCSHSLQYCLSSWWEIWIHFKLQRYTMTASFFFLHSDVNSWTSAFTITASLSKNTLGKCSTFW